MGALLVFRSCRLDVAKVRTLSQKGLIQVVGFACLIITGIQRNALKALELQGEFKNTAYPNKLLFKLVTA
jgi:hypothetical protein